MNKLAGFAFKVYSLLLFLYPAAFRNEFREQMLLDFSDMANDAKEQGRLAFVEFWIRELYHFPASMLQAHWKEGAIGRILRSQPLNYVLQNAFLFGLAFGLALIVSTWVSESLPKSGLDVMSVSFFDTFHTELDTDVFYWIPSILGSLVTSFMIGVAFALVFADRPNRIKYAFIAMICWFLSREALGILLNTTTNLYYYLGLRYGNMFLGLTSIVSALFLGLIFYLPNPENRIPLRLMVLGMIGYPILTYFYLRLLYKFSIIEGRTMFPALILLLLLYSGSILAVAVKSGSSGKVPWAIIVFTIGYLVLGRIATSVYFSVFPAPPIPVAAGTPSGNLEYSHFITTLIIYNTINNIFIGLVIGAVFGLLNHRRVQQAAA